MEKWSFPIYQFYVIEYNYFISFYWNSHDNFVIVNGALFSLHEANWLAPDTLNVHIIFGLTECLYLIWCEFSFGKRMRFVFFFSNLCASLSPEILFFFLFDVAFQIETQRFSIFSSTFISNRCCSVFRKILNSTILPNKFLQ